MNCQLFHNWSGVTCDFFTLLYFTEKGTRTVKPLFTFCLTFPLLNFSKINDTIHVVFYHLAKKVDKSKLCLWKDSISAHEPSDMKCLSVVSYPQSFYTRLGRFLPGQLSYFVYVPVLKYLSSCMFSLHMKWNKQDAYLLSLGLSVRKTICFLCLYQWWSTANAECIFRMRFERIIPKVR